MFIPRLITTCVLLVLMSFIIIFSKTIVGYAIPLIISLLCFLGTYELFFMAEYKGNTVLRNPVFIFSVVYIWGLFFILKTGGNPNFIDSAVIFLLMSLFFLGKMINNKENLGKSSSVMEGISISLFAFIYISWCMGFVIKLLFIPQMDGRILVFFLILVAKSTDIFGYVFGKTMGKKKIAPTISPGKTVEGTIGGISCAVFIGLLFHGFVLSKYFNLLETLIISLLVAVVSFFGDLAESLLKRDSEIKDSGGLIPGLGGVLDLLDSVLLSAPLLYFCVKIFL
ncbi:MAG: Phosphatidate cytidylyltransferase [uncultured bacterium]|nr:MAG: Phosphatidate cytidylyltransferase [uncultured bacterium]